MTSTALKRTRRRYTPAEIEQALATLVIAGNAVKAQELTGIPNQTLSDWKHEHAARFEEMRHEYQDKIALQAAAEAESIAQRLADLEHRHIDRILATVDDLKPNELASALRNITTSKALQYDKVSNPLRERPSHMQQHLNVVDLVTQLSSRLGFDATSTATEIPNEAVQIPLSGDSGASNARS